MRIFQKTGEKNHDTFEGNLGVKSGEDKVTEGGKRNVRIGRCGMAKSKGKNSSP
jgi:hypothetical protein